MRSCIDPGALAAFSRRCDYRSGVSQPDRRLFPEGLEDLLASMSYTLEEFVARGGSGTVLRARGTDGQPVAVKVLDPGVSAGRLQREADTLAQMNHPGVPKVQHVADLAGRPVLISEWVDGAPLSELLRSAPLSPERAIAIFSGIASVLDRVHEQSVVHRDLSPDNIIVSDNNAVTIIDFGISTGADSATITTDNAAAGTPRYIAPEALAGSDPTPAADQYSAAVVAYEMLTGQWPYGDGADSVATSLHHHLHSAVTPLSEANPWLGHTFDPIFAKALAKDPDERFASLGELAGDLAAARPQPSTTKNRLPVALIAAAVAVVAIGVLLWRPWSNGLQQDAPSWPAGTAAALTCNLFEVADFEEGQQANTYYVDIADRNDISVAGGVDQTAGLRVGASGDFGLYGEIVPITGGLTYRLRLFVAPTADVQAASIRLTVLDGDFEILQDANGTDVEVEQTLLPGTTDVAVLEIDVPSNGRYLIPALVKDGPDGYLLADELVLAPASAPCWQDNP